MNLKTTVIPKLWVMFELEGYREVDDSSTYDSFAYEGLPPVQKEAFNGKYEWLKQSEIHEQSIYAVDKSSSRLAELLIRATQKNIRLPEEFINFMRAPELLEHLRSNTDCFFELSEDLIESPVEKGDFLIRFLNDSQSCLFWYLYITKDNDHFVVVSGKLLDPEDDDQDDEDEYYEDEVYDSDNEPQIFFCASGFEEFIYRFWIENEIWYSLCYDHKPLTQLQLNYVEHYKDN